MHDERWDLSASHPNDPYYLSFTFLDFRFKNFEFFKEDSIRSDKLQEVKEFLLNYFEKYIFEESNSSSKINPNNRSMQQISLNINEQLEPNRRKNDFNKFLENIFDKKSSNSSVNNEILFEIDKYLSFQVETSDSLKKSPLEFYHHYNGIFPNLTKIAKKIFHTASNFSAIRSVV